MTRLYTNHKYTDEVNTVVQLFFPLNNTNPGEYLIKSLVNESCATAEVYLMGKLISSDTRSILNTPHYFSTKRLIMLTVFCGLKKAMSVNIPWGALTGIRPSKMVREWLDYGYSNKDVMNILHDSFFVTKEKASIAINVAIAEKKINSKIYEKYKNPIGIYISIPFCPSRCVYCSFNTSYKLAKEKIQIEYIDALIIEMEKKAKEIIHLGGTVSSIYIGGGTPTALEAYLLEKLLFAVENNFNTNCEYTVEAGRPDTLTKEKLNILQKYNVSRIAVNSQTLNNKTLKIIGRNHTAEDFTNAVNRTRDAGFYSINTDIIVGLPEEGIDDIYKTMDGIIKLSLENITIHTLAIKRASHIRYNQNSFVIGEAANIEAMLEYAAKTCISEGFDPYYLYRQKNTIGMLENIGYSKPGYECEYNVGMMSETQTVLGIGAGATSKYIKGTKISRIFNNKDIDVYIRKIKNTDTSQF